MQVFALGKYPVTTWICYVIHTVIPKTRLWPPRGAVDQKALEKKLLICKQIVKSTLSLPSPITHITLICKIALTFVLDYLLDWIQSQLCFSDLGRLGKSSWGLAKTWSALKHHLWTSAIVSVLMRCHMGGKHVCQSFFEITSCCISLAPFSAPSRARSGNCSSVWC